MIPHYQTISFRRSRGDRPVYKVDKALRVARIDFVHDIKTRSDHRGVSVRRNHRAASCSPPCLRTTTGRVCCSCRALVPKNGDVHCSGKPRHCLFHLIDITECKGLQIACCHINHNRPGILGGVSRSSCNRRVKSETVVVSDRRCVSKNVQEVRSGSKILKAQSLIVNCSK